MGSILCLVICANLRRSAKYISGHPDFSGKGKKIGEMFI
jgi:hypothetical protein